MKPDQVKAKLKELNACAEAYKWADGKSMSQIWETCPRGDWMLWLWARIYPDDLRTLALAKGYCAKTVIHLMKDQRSKDAVKAAIDFGRGRIGMKKLNAYAADAYAAYAAAAYAAYAAAYAANAYAAYAAAAYAANAAYAAYAAAYAANAAAAYAATQMKNQKATADICRKYLKCPKWKC